MLRYLAAGIRNFSRSPMAISSRFNWEFYANLKGRLRPTFSGSSPVFTSLPTLWVFRPDMQHGWEGVGNVDRIVFHFSSVPDSIRDACGERGYLVTSLHKSDTAMLRKLVTSLQSHVGTCTPASLLLFERALIDLCLLFLRNRALNATLPLEAVAVERVERAIAWYTQRLDKRPTLEAVADAIHVSLAHLRRQFQLVHGRSPHAVFTEIRVNKAADLLATTTHKLEVIAEQSGFNSASDLCRVFHQYFRIYPNVWRSWLSGPEQSDRKKQLERLLNRNSPAGLLSPGRTRLTASAGRKPASLPDRDMSSPAGAADLQARAVPEKSQP